VLQLLLRSHDAFIIMKLYCMQYNKSYNSGNLLFTLRVFNKINFVKLYILVDKKFTERAPPRQLSIGCVLITVSSGSAAAAAVLAAGLTVCEVAMTLSVAVLG